MFYYQLHPLYYWIFAIYYHGARLSLFGLNKLFMENKQ